jgi:hypothetical protein
MLPLYRLQHMTDMLLAVTTAKRILCKDSDLKFLSFFKKICYDTIVEQQVIDTFHPLQKKPAIQARRMGERQYL